MNTKRSFFHWNIEKSQAGQKARPITSEENRTISPHHFRIAQKLQNTFHSRKYLNRRKQINSNNLYIIDPEILVCPISILYFLDS